MEAKPPSTSSGGPQKSDDKVRTLMTEVKKGKVKEEVESPSIKVGIGISAAHGSVIIKQGKPKPLLTSAQLDELRRQVVIYKYIAAGLPVPAALVLPIWKGVADSFGFASGGIYRLYPSFVGFSPQEFDYRNMMDPEPGRCRRTDGKKWRCRKDVVPGQKYCEGHMHRGRQRSRKHVETSQTVSASNATPPNNSSKNSENSNINSSSSAPAVLSNKPGISYKSSGSACSNVDARIVGRTKTTSVVGAPKNVSTAITLKGIASCINAAAIMINHTVYTDSSITTGMIGTNKSGSNNNHKIEGVDDRNGNCSNSVSFENIINSGNNSRNIRNAQGATSRGLDFSPKSVLRVQGCRGACFCRSDAELEPERCRRTDGKKWRCRRDVVPNEKYCKMHMHRGAKKRTESSQSPTLLNATLDTSTSACLHSTAILPDKGDGTDLNTNLSIAISANPQLETNDDMSDTTISMSSDTTISDTIVASCEDGDFSS